MDRFTYKPPPHYVRRYTDEQILAASLLTDIPLLSQIPAHHLRELARTARYVTFPSGEVIIHEGEPGASLYVIRSGRVDVVRGAERDGRVVLASLGPGEYFGELSLFDTGPRSATVVATDHTEAVVIGHHALLQLVQRQPELALSLLKTLCQRLRRTDELLENAPRPHR